MATEVIDVCYICPLKGDYPYEYDENNGIPNCPEEEIKKCNKRLITFLRSPVELAGNLVGSDDRVSYKLSDRAPSDPTERGIPARRRNER